MLRRSVMPALAGIALFLVNSVVRAEPVQRPQDSGPSGAGVYNPIDSSEFGPVPGNVEYTAVGGGTNGNITAVNSLLSGVGLYIGTEWYGWTDTQRKSVINSAAGWGFSFLSPKIASESGNTWYTSTTQLDNWISWCNQAGIKFFPYSYVNPSTGGTGTTIATNRAAAIAAEIAQHCGLVLVDMEAEWQLTKGAYGPNMTAFGIAYRSVCPDKPIVVTGFGDPQTVQGSSWPYTEMKSFADAYAPQWYYPWWSWYRGTKGVAGVKNVIDTCYNQCKTYFGATYPMLPNAAWEADPSDASTPAALPDLYAGTAYMRKFNAPIIWWEYTSMTRAIASALVGYGYFTDQAVPSGSPTRPAPIVASSTTVAGGGQVTFTINIGGPAPVGGQSIGLASSNTAALSVPATVTVPRGSSSVNVTLTTGSVAANTQATLTASNNATGTTVTAAKTITVTQAGYPVTSLTAIPASVPAGDSATGTVTISAPAMSGGQTISLSSNSPGVVVPAAGVTIPAGMNTATFPISTAANGDSTITATITASFGASSSHTTFTVTPVGVASLTLQPAALVAGQRSVGTITLLGPAPSSGLTVALSSSSSAAQVPVEGVSIASGQTTGTFDIVTSPTITSTVFATISAGYNGVTVPATLAINALGVSTLSLSPLSTRGGETVIGTITLTSDAPAGGVDVTVLSDTPEVATVTSPVRIAEGSKTGTFPIVAQPVLYTGFANITASLNEGTSTQSITVRPRYDVNGDDVFDTNDVTAALRIAAGLSVLPADQTASADVDGSGSVDIADVAALIRKALAL